MAAIDSRPSAEFPSSKGKERNALALTIFISRAGTRTSRSRTRALAERGTGECRWQSLMTDAKVPFARFLQGEKQAFGAGGGSPQAMPCGWRGEME